MQSFIPIIAEGTPNGGAEVFVIGLICLVVVFIIQLMVLKKTDNFPLPNIWLN